jgi:hypothetical protein
MPAHRFERISVRTLYRAAAALAFALTSLVAPAGAATSGDVIAQAAAGQGTLTGRVTNSRGDGLSGAVVTVSGGATTRTATTAGDGTFTLAVPPGVYSVVVNRGGFQTTQTDDVAVVAGGTARLAIALSESSTQSLRTIGRVSTSTNRNPINVNVAAVSSASRRTSTTSPRSCPAFPSPAPQARQRTRSSRRAASSSSRR